MQPSGASAGESDSKSSSTPPPPLSPRLLLPFFFFRDLAFSTETSFTVLLFRCELAPTWGGGGTAKSHRRRHRHRHPAPCEAEGSWSGRGSGLERVVGTTSARASGGRPLTALRLLAWTINRPLVLMFPLSLSLSLTLFPPRPLSPTPPDDDHMASRNIP